MHTYLPLLDDLAAKDRFGVHQLVRDPRDADIILFLDAHQHFADLSLEAIRQHRLTKEFRAKAFVYSEQDQPWCAMPGLYVSMPKSSFDWQHQRPCSYIAIQNNLVVSSIAGADNSPDVLFSFVGRRGNRTRDRILNVTHPRAVINDTSAFDFFGSSRDALTDQKERYASLIRRSKFVLCPKGAGASSFRIFETLAAGRVPVILSDEWVAPTGPEWNAFALIIPERDVERVAAILEAAEPKFERMAMEARKAWDDWFAPDVLFHRMIENCQDILLRRETHVPLFSPWKSGRYARLRVRQSKSQFRHACGCFVKRLRHFRNAYTAAPAS